MKGINTNYTFNPSLKQVDFSTTPSFDVRRLTAIINTTANQIIYASGKSGYGIASVAGSVVTLQYDTTSMNASDKLSVFYDNTVISVDTGLSQPLTDTQLRASAIPVSGSVSITNSNIEITNDVGNPIPVNGSVSVSNFPATQAVSAASLPLPSGASTSALQTSGNSTLTSIDNKTPSLGQAVMASSTPVVIASNQSAIPVSGTVTISNSALEITNDVGNPIPVSGTVNTGLSQPLTDTQLRATAVPVSGSISVSNFPATQTVAGTVTANAGTGTFQTNITNASIAVTGPLTDAQLRAAAVPVSGTITGITNTVVIKADTAANQTNSLKVDGSAVTQPISASTLPLPSGAATSALQTTGNTTLSSILSSQTTIGSQTTKINDGTNTAAVKAASSVPVAADPALVVSLSPNSSQVHIQDSNGASILVGQQTMANSVSVTIASNQTTIPVEMKASSSATYSAAIVGGASANNASDIFTIYGSATKTIRVTRLAITATQTTAAQRDVLLIKRSTANTAGNSTLPNIVPHDSTSTAATATVRAYTTNPTLGTSIGNVRSRKVYVGTTTGNSDECIFEFGTRGNQAVILRGTNEGLCVNLNSVTSSGGLWNISVEWVEQ